MGTIKFSIVTPERTVYEDEIDELVIPTPMGEMGILPNHIPLVGALSAGQITIKKKGVDLLLAVGGGIVEIKKGSNVVLLADSAEREEEINVERAEKARKRAEEMLKEKKFADDVEYANLQASLERSVARLKIARKHRSHH